MANKNYFLDKNSKTGEILYLEYDKIKGYNITPKTRIEDAIEVNKIIFINPSMSKKLIKKKIDIKIRALLNFLNSDDDTEEGISKNLMDAEKLRMNILTIYVKYLGHTYQSLTLKKIQIIINQLRIKLYDKTIKKRKTIDYDNLYYLDEDIYKPKQGRSR